MKRSNSKKARRNAGRNTQPAGNTGAGNPVSGQTTEAKPYDSRRALQSLKDHFRMAANDGYINTAARIGAASPLMAGGTFIRSNLTFDQEQLTTAYRDNWVAKRVIDMPAEDITKAWYTLNTKMSEEALEKLRRLEAKHSLKQELTNAIRWARLYGGSLVVMVIAGEEDRLELPLDYDILLPDCFQGILVLDRTDGIIPSEEKVSDINDPDFGEPEYYTVELNGPIGGAGPREVFDPATGRLRTVPTIVKIHHSRVVRFIGRELPKTERDREQGWGASELEHLWDALLRLNSASANIAQLIFQANITTLKMNDLMEMLAIGTDEKREAVLKALEADDYFRTSYGVQLLGKDDSMENLSFDFAGLPEIYDRFMMDMAGAAEIPATKLFGRSPQGMNATGEHDMRNYYEMIASLQERMLRPALEKLLPVMAISCWGYIPEDMEIIFEPVMTMSAEDKVSLAGKHSEVVRENYRAGLITLEEAREEIGSMSRRTGVLSGIGGKAE
ncbi:MAG: DUF1073 domain-containing protein [Clostridia bacterium]|nr:DUF1073 domain-containing protein [Clostridia bacterium]